MKIAVVGGGTAGYIAAAHLSHYLPKDQLIHVFDPSIPTIGVGEGTTPRFPIWFKEVTGWDFTVLAERCRATWKKGVSLDGWGPEGAEFIHRFQPIWLEGYHFDAGALLDVIGEHIHAQRVSANVESMRTMPDGVELRLAGGAVHFCDYVLDARGFPRPGDGALPEDLIPLDWIPTGRAVLRWLPPDLVSDMTRAAARPHGWIFQIPLQGSTSCGYIFNPRINTDVEIREDFTAFLQGEGIAEWKERGTLSFPNYMRRTLFDGRIFRVGNAAAFLEPLEATAIGSAIVQIRSATEWMSSHGSASRADPEEIEAHNAGLRTYICRDSLFVAWHYANGSRWDTAFWKYARKGIDRASVSDLAREHVAAMHSFIEAGRLIPGRLVSGYDDKVQWDKDVFPMLHIFTGFGNFSELNFAQIGHGIGIYGL
jgi:hypothetical protein